MFLPICLGGRRIRDDVLLGNVRSRFWAGVPQRDILDRLLRLELFASSQTLICPRARAAPDSGRRWRAGSLALGTSGKAMASMVPIQGWLESIDILAHSCRENNLRNSIYILDRKVFSFYAYVSSRSPVNQRAST